MSSFSQRKGIKPLQKSMQIESLDVDLRNRLWSVIYSSIFEEYESPNPYGNRSQAAVICINIAKFVWTDYFKLQADTFFEPDPNRSKSSFHPIKNLIINGPWNEALDLLEFLLKSIPESWEEEIIEDLNKVFESENASFRIIGLEITEITDPIEVESIESAIQNTRGTTHTHLAKALELLSDRKLKDFRNSIKESISAVEAASQAVAQKSGATLNEALREIKKSRTIHPAFERSLISLYGYTSDSGGIRHALTEDTVHPTYADAKLLLVTSAAFVNYIFTVAAEDKINIE